MAAQSGIEWTDSTFNPWMGCTKISPACDHCYAERDMDTRLGRVKWGAGQPRVRTSAQNWNRLLRWNKTQFCECDACGYRGDDFVSECPSCWTHSYRKARRRVFCASLADWLDNEVPIEWLVDLLDLIRRTPNLDWLLLTKRIGNWRSRLTAAMEYAERHPDGSYEHPVVEWLGEWLGGIAFAPRNVWLGATVIDQLELERDARKLLNALARVRFLSIEPMLGPIDLSSWLNLTVDAPGRWQDNNKFHEPWCIHWVIAGGESGPRARPVHPEWIRSLRDQCAAAGVPFLFKQWGEWGPRSESLSSGRRSVAWSDSLGEWVAPTSGNNVEMHLLGKRDAGRLLDGRTWDGFPRSAQ